MPSWTYENYLGAVNTERKEPVVEAEGKAWYTRKSGGHFALFPDQWAEDGSGMVLERLPSGVQAEDPYGNVVTVP